MKNIALITGSYGGLGTCFVNIHASAGGDLILVGRSQSKLDAQAAEVSSTYGVKAVTIDVDLSQPEAAQVIYDTCKAGGWNPDIIINNAGFGGQGDHRQYRTRQGLLDGRCRNLPHREILAPTQPRHAQHHPYTSNAKSQ